MSEIKYRAWRPANRMEKNAAMLSWEDLEREVSLDWLIRHQGNTGFELMQYTGLKDKNGREIYEGDIITMEPHSLPFEVKYYSGGFHMIEPHSRTTRHAGSPDSMPIVIGNIYENPELLEAK
jgi:uncharacterized phage protein (TIGR01671 family)